jgi:hypothetical protein
MTVPDEDKQRKPDAPAGNDFENCKGQCGYTIWCRACMEERKKLLDEIERKEAAHADERYA